MQVDWTEVEKLNPHGYMELQGDGQVVHGNVDKVCVDDHDMVNISLKWSVSRPISEMGIPTTREWGEVVSNPKTISFPNFVMPYCIESTPEKGDRVRFAGVNILYIETPSPLKLGVVVNR